MAIFNSYVKLPEGTYVQRILEWLNDRCLLQGGATPVINGL